MQKPIVHLNGTSHEDLLHKWDQVSCGVRGLMTAMLEAAPHPRDYYPMGDDAYRKASEEHKNKLNQLAEINEYAKEMVEHLLETI